MSSSTRSRLILLLAAAAVLMGLWTATQQVAGAYRYPQEFGRGWADFGAVRLYPPWAICGWFVRYARAYPRAFDMACLWGLAAGFLPIIVAIRLGRARRAPAAFGAAAWRRAPMWRGQA